MTKKISRARINLYNLNNNRFYQLVNASLTIAKNMQLDSTHLIISTTETIQENMQLLFSIMSKEKTYSQRKELDEIRDQNYNYLITMLDAFAISRQEDKKQAASSLLSVFTTFNKDLDQLPFDEETAELDKLMHIWSSEESTLHFKTLGLSGDFSTLQQSIQDFNTYTIERPQQEAENDLPKVRDLRKNIRKEYNMWLNLLESMANLYDEENYYFILNKINELIKEQDSYLKMKNTLKHAEA